MLESMLKMNHIKLVSATEPISDSPAGIMMKSVLIGIEGKMQRLRDK